MVQKLIKYLQSQGLGSAKTCRQRLKNGSVAVNGEVITAAAYLLDPAAVKEITIDSVPCLSVPVPFFYLALHKPLNYEVSHRSFLYPSVYTLLPVQLQNLAAAAVGRLDVETTGLLIITNNGRFNHYLTAPKRHIEKEYRVTLKHQGAEDVASRLLTGVLLKDGISPVRAVKVHIIDAFNLTLTVTSGQYHQVRRMVAAAGNRVQTLERIRVGSLLLPPELKAGDWRFISPGEVVANTAKFTWTD